MARVFNKSLRKGLLKLPLDTLESNAPKTLIKTLQTRLESQPLAYNDMQTLLASYDADMLELELFKAQGYPLYEVPINPALESTRKSALDSVLSRLDSTLDSADLDSVSLDSSDVTTRCLAHQNDTSNIAYVLGTTITPYVKGRLCFVDIETTGARPKESQIIEIGAIAYENGGIVGRFEEFIYAESVPEIITEITGITSSMLQDARKLEDVLADFRIFLGDSVFVAHNVGFDYSFVSHMLESLQLGTLLNPKLCTIDLARRCILAKRYSLQHLNELLGINIPTAHRAYADAQVCLEVFKIACLCLPKSVRTIHDLINFSKSPLKKVKC